MYPGGEFSRGEDENGDKATLSNKRLQSPCPNLDTQGCVGSIPEADLSVNGPP